MTILPQCWRFDLAAGAGQSSSDRTMSSGRAGGMIIVTASQLLTTDDKRFSAHDKAGTWWMRATIHICHQCLDPGKGAFDECHAAPVGRGRDGVPASP